MSKNAPNTAVTQFESTVHHKFTAKASGFQMLGRYKSNVVGDKVSWPVLGYSMMHEHVVGQPITPANGSRAPVEATLKNWAIGDWTSIFDQQVINYNDMQESASIFADAMQNRMIQIIIDALAAETIPAANKVAIDISGADANLTVAANRKAAEILDNMGVPEEDRVLMAAPSGIHNMTKDPAATSSDFVTKVVMETGKLPGFYGFNYKKVPDLKEGGMPGKGTSERKYYAYGKNAMGIATGVWKDAQAEYQGLYGAWWVHGLLSAIAKVIDVNGVVEITAKNEL